jgi:hypothetical protein
MNEHGLTDNVRKLLAALKKLKAPLYGIKIHGNRFQKANQPDWFICIKGLLYLLETKHPDEDPVLDPGQVIEFAKWEFAGAELIVLNNLNDIKMWLLIALRNAYAPTRVPAEIEKLLQPKRQRVS